MALLDIMDAVSQKQVTKTALGDERITGVVVGIVAENYDEKMPGRVCVNVPVRDEGANELKWAKVAAFSRGKNWGDYFIPEKQDQVLLAFENGNIEKPYVIGCISRDNDSFLRKCADEKNKNKKIVTRNGSYILFEDGGEEKGGEQDRITIATSQDTHKMVLDNENQKMILTDKQNNCHVEMFTEDGRMEIKAAKKLIFEVGDNIKVILDGDSGAIRVQADKFVVETSGNIGMEADGNIRMSGGQIMAEASSVVKLDSSEMVKITGNPIKLG
ncbi:MAG: hypothetical protein J6B10_03010 [Lachnospiraceae bacterium]|nr:hypothetical protein [Lachnospiraceae bacterium]